MLQKLITYQHLTNESFTTKYSCYKYVASQYFLDPIISQTLWVYIWQGSILNTSIKSVWIFVSPHCVLLQLNKLWLEHTPLHAHTLSHCQRTSVLTSLFLQQKQLIRAQRENLTAPQPDNYSLLPEREKGGDREKERGSSRDEGEKQRRREEGSCACVPVAILKKWERERERERSV